VDRVKTVYYYLRTRKRYIQTPEEEVANSITHGIGAGLSIAGFIILLLAAYSGGGFWKITSLIIFGASMVALYLSSTVYHMARRPGVKYLLRICDHSTIFLLIAGTYTPFALVTLRDEGGWVIFSIIWALAGVGIIFKIFFVEKMKIISPLLYLLMGWMIVLLVEPMSVSMPQNGIILLLAGGLSYSVGLIFFAWHRIPFNHSIWHVFVMGGTACHFFGFLFYL
jgi:hemolysin III